MLHWYKIAETEDALPWQENGMCMVLVADKPRLLLRFGGELYAMAAFCPHAGAVLAEGFVSGRGEVVCPLHDYRFRVRDGYNSSGEGYRLRCHVVERRADGIYLGVAEVAGA